MYTVTHLTLALVLSSLFRSRYPHRALFLFVLGFLPDVEHLYMHRFLFHNILFLAIYTALFRVLSLGVAFHFFDDFLLPASAYYFTQLNSLI